MLLVIGLISSKAIQVQGINSIKALEFFKRKLEEDHMFKKSGGESSIVVSARDILNSTPQPFRSTIKGQEMEKAVSFKSDSTTRCEPDTSRFV